MGYCLICQALLPAHGNEYFPSSYFPFVMMRYGNVELYYSCTLNQLTSHAFLSEQLYLTRGGWNIFKQEKNVRKPPSRIIIAYIIVP
jgi:hypothetical protein